MNAAFDPYYKWLAIPPAEQPPDHYRLLGVQRFEPNVEVISQSADRQMAFVQSFKTGPHSAESQKLLNELSAARLCLTNPAKKAAYDAELRASAAASAVVAPPAPDAALPFAVPVATPAEPFAQPFAPLAPTTLPAFDANPFAGRPPSVAAPIAPVARPASAGWMPAPLIAGAVFGAVVGLGAAFALSGSPARATPTTIKPLPATIPTAPVVASPLGPAPVKPAPAVEPTTPQPEPSTSTSDARPRFSVPTPPREESPSGGPPAPVMVEGAGPSSVNAQAATPGGYVYERHSLAGVAPERRLLGKAEGLCTLAGVTGGFAGNLERVWAKLRDDEWRAGIGTEQASLGVDVGVVKFPTSGYEFTEHVWSRGEPLPELINADEGICLLSGVGGGFLGFLEQVRLDVDDDGRWRLNVHTEQATSVIVTSVKIPNWRGRVSFRDWHQAGPPVDLIAADEGFCFLAGMMGRYRTADQFVKLSIENGRWTLAGNDVEKPDYDTQFVGTGAVACIVRTQPPVEPTALDSRVSGETPADPAQATALADALWQEADRNTDAAAREATKRRAAELIRSTLVDLSGRERKQARDRLLDFERQYPSFPIGKWSPVAPFIDLREHAIRGDWKQSGDVFENTKTWSCIAVPLIPTGSYELRARIKRLEGDDTIFLGLPIGSTHIRVGLSATHGQHHCLVDGQGLPIERPECSHSPGVLVNNREYLVRCEVTVRGDDAVLEVMLDGARILRWRGPIASVAPALGKFHSVRCVRFETAGALATYREVEMCVRSNDVRFDVN